MVLEYTLAALRGLSFLGGGSLLYMALFLYEDEDSKAQNVLESWWVKATDSRKKTISWHRHLLTEVGTTVAEALALLFGKELVSWRSIRLSISYSLGFACIWSIIIQWPGDLDTFLRSWPIRVLFVLGGCNIIRIATKVYVGSDQVKFRALLSMGLAVLALTSIVYLPIMFYREGLGDSAWLSAVGVGILSAVGLGYDIVFIALTRRITSVVIGSLSFFGSLVLVVANTVLVSLGGIAPLYAATRVADTIDLGGGLDANTVRMILRFVSASNTPAVLVSLFFLVVATSLVIHRLAWPVIQRPIYSLQRYQIIGHKKKLIALGVLLVSLAHPASDVGILSILRALGLPK